MPPEEKIGIWLTAAEWKTIDALLLHAQHELSLPPELTEAASKFACIFGMACLPNKAVSTPQEKV